jgi:hypothetical protein
VRKSILDAAKWAYRTQERVIGHLAERDYHLAKAYYMYRLRRAARRHKGTPLLVYQMGKVGSKTVIRSLRDLKLDMPVYHVHFLTQSLIDEYLEKRRAFLGTEKQGRLKHVWLYEYLRKQLDDGLGDKKWKVVTLTRDPVARNISSFFENIDVEPLDSGRRYHVQSDADFYGFDIVVDAGDMSALVQMFLERLDHREPLTYFDQELQGVLGVDVYSSDFPTAQGYQIYEHKLADVLLIRLENLDTCARDAFSRFLGVENFVLVNENVGSAKAYAPLYKEFRESVALPNSYLDEMYASRYVRHFYSEGEIAEFRVKWSTCQRDS